MTLFNEVLNKGAQPFAVTIGHPIQPASLPARSEEGIAILRDAVLNLPPPSAQATQLSQIRRLSQVRHAMTKPHPIE